MRSYSIVVRFIGGVAAISYGVGLLVWSMYLSTLGITEVALTKAHYLLTGANVFIVFLPPMILGAGIVFSLKDGSWRRLSTYRTLFVDIIWVFFAFLGLFELMFGQANEFGGALKKFFEIYTSGLMIFGYSGIFTLIAGLWAYYLFPTLERTPLTASIRKNEEDIEDIRRLIGHGISSDSGNSIRYRDKLDGLREERAELYRKKESHPIFSIGPKMGLIYIVMLIGLMPLIQEYSTHIHPRIDYSLGGAKPRLVLAQLSPSSTKILTSLGAESSHLSSLYDDVEAVVTGLFYETSELYIFFNPMSDSPKAIHIPKDNVRGMAILATSTETSQRDEFTRLIAEHVVLELSNLVESLDEEQRELLVEELRKRREKKRQDEGTPPTRQEDNGSPEDGLD